MLLIRVAYVVKQFPHSGTVWKVWKLCGNKRVENVWKVEGVWNVWKSVGKCGRYCVEDVWKICGKSEVWNLCGKVWRAVWNSVEDF
jgi:hypothetical protein